MFSRDKEALAARSENTATTQEPKTEKPSDLCSKPSENQEDIPPPEIYRTEFFLKGEDPILEEPEVEHTGTPPVEDSQMKPTSTKIDNKLSGSASNIDETNKVQASVKPLAKFPFTKDSQQKVSESTNSKLSDNENKLNKDQSSLKPLSKFSFAKQVKVPESSGNVVQDTKLKNQLNYSNAVEHNEKTCTTMEVEKNDGISEKKDGGKMKTPESSSVIEEKPVIPAESAKSVESQPPVTYRSEFVLWGSTDKTDQSEEYKTKNIELENSKSLFNSNSLDTLKSSTTEKIDPPLKQDSKTDIKMRENSGKQLSSSASKQLNVQRPKLDTSPKSSQVNQNSRSEEVPTNQSKVYDKSEVSSDDKVPKKVEPEEKPTTTEKRKQSIYGDVLVKNDNIKIFGIQVKSDVAPKVNETKIDLKTSAEKKTSDTRKVENLNGMKKNEKTVIPQFLNKKKIEANAKKVDEENKIQKKNESSSSFLKKNVLESKPLIANKPIDEQSEEQLLNGNVSSLKTKTSSPESLPVEKVQKPLPNVSTSLTKTDKTPETNLMEKSALLKDVKAVNDGKNTGDTKKETLSKPEDSKITNQLVKQSSASSSSPEVSKKTVVDDKNDARFSKGISIQDKNTQSVPDKIKSETTILEKSKITKPEEEAKPSLFGLKTSIEKTELGKSDEEIARPSLKLMNGGKLSISQDEDSVNGVEEKHLSINPLKEESSVEDDTSKKEDRVSSPKSTSVLKNQEVSIPTTTANQVITEVEKDSSKKLVGKTKEKSVTKIARVIGTKKGSKEAKKEDLTKDVSVSMSGQKT
ncbi:hypothetical protein LSTR_LSTR015918 [Laodelphax striatellus]|uniref:Uncharacterized protein n=1 Tax=Laodelphax striatellus TaxID=195883 RepID=A0A482XEW8_LAOST|nr:hypothetical protein LSTR_LSTR015918 [Laodelphax striatellus]